MGLSLIYGIRRTSAKRAHEICVQGWVGFVRWDCEYLDILNILKDGRFGFERSDYAVSPLNRRVLNYRLGRDLLEVYALHMVVFREKRLANSDTRTLFLRQSKLKLTITFYSPYLIEGSSNRFDPTQLLSMTTVV